ERILDATAAAGRRRLNEADALRVLEAYDIPVTPWRFVSQEGGESLATAAGAAARRLGFPVAFKIVSPEVIHKTDVGGVMLDLDSEEAVGRAVRAMVRRVSQAAGAGEAVGADAAGTGQKKAKAKIDGILVQRMAARGRETIVGLTRVPRVGPLVMFGLGGVYVEVLRDVVLRLSPLRDTDAAEMLREVKMRRLLEGVRGEPPRDLEALTATLLRVSQLAQRHPRISELDINPLLAMEKGAVAVDARVQLADEPPP
ncbi:MAG TPA: acetate--CoA ligase family protein, partial [Gemmatimonadales bacterium]|nr:acetate--CoA ligase family protein [Gemmatimonadales bacterium]